MKSIIKGDSEDRCYICGRAEEKIIYKIVEKLLTNAERGCIIKVRKDKREYENDKRTKKGNQAHLCGL